MVESQPAGAAEGHGDGAAAAGETPRQRRHGWVSILLACALGGAILAPVLTATFYGDDYDLWHGGRMLLDDPSTILVGPRNCYRPANSWFFAVHHLVFGTRPAPYHAVTLLMHLGCGALLGLVLRRFGCPAWGLFAAVAFWLTSPYSFEPVMFVNVSYNDLTVILVWLGLAVLWPGPGTRWQRWRVVAAAALILFSLFCKETWVVVAALAGAYELFIAQGSLRRALKVSLLVAVPVVFYLAVYLLLAPQGRGYFAGGVHVLAKVPHLWAVFSMLGMLEPHKPGLGVRELAALLLMAGCAMMAWRRRSRLIALGFALFLIPLPPILPVPWIAVRYTTAPLVGFVLVMVGVATELVRSAVPRLRRLVALGVGAVAAVALLVNVVWLQGELDDMRVLGEAHDRLVEEARQFATQIEAGQALVCLRTEYVNPLVDLQEGGYTGVEKIQFQRDGSPYGLISWAALFTYVRTGCGDELFVEVDPGSLDETVPYSVVGHGDGGFRLLRPHAGSLEAEVEAWTELGAAVTVVAPCRSGRVTGISRKHETTV